MPRKASGTSAKANAKGGVTANVPAAADGGGGGSQIFENQIVGNPASATTTTTTVAPSRGGGGSAAATRGGKRRRTSNNVNSNLSGSEMYGSGTIVASNPFDDDTLPVLSAAHHNIAGNAKMTMINRVNMHPHSPSMHHQVPPQHQQPQLPPPSHHHHHHHHQQQQQHPPPPPPHHQHHHQHQQSMHHHHNQLMYSQPHHNNHPHYQQPTVHQGIPPQSAYGDQMVSPPQPPSSLASNHLSPPQQQPQQQFQQQMHSDHLGGLQQVPPPVHDHGGHHMIPAYAIPANHPGHIHPYQHPQQQLQPQVQQQPQVIGSSTPPAMLMNQAALPATATTHPPPYNPNIQPGHMMQPLHSTVIAASQGQGPQQHQHQPLEQINVQQAPTNAADAYHIGYCGKCQRELFRDEAHIICKAGCKSFYHISCSGLTQFACDLLMKESLAEWACDRCMSGNGRAPYIKYKT